MDHVYTARAHATFNVMIIVNIGYGCVHDRAILYAY